MTMAVGGKRREGAIAPPSRRRGRMAGLPALLLVVMSLSFYPPSVLATQMIDSFVYTHDASAFLDFDIHFSGNELSVGDRYAFMNIWDADCVRAEDTKFAFTVDNVDSVSSDLSVVNQTISKMEGGVWTVCYRFYNNSMWNTLPGNLTVSGPRYYQINSTDSWKVQPNRKDDLRFELFGYDLRSGVDRWALWPHSNACPSRQHPGTVVEPPLLRQGEGHDVLEFTTSDIEAGEYTVCYSWNGRPYVVVSHSLFVNGARFFYTDCSPPVTGTDFDLVVAGFGMLPGDTYSLHRGSDCSAPVEAPLSVVISESRRLELTYNLAWAGTFASVFTFCYNFNSMGLEPIEFHGPFVTTTEPALPARDETFALNITGEGFTPKDRWVLVSQRLGHSCKDFNMPLGCHDPLPGFALALHQLQYGGLQTQDDFLSTKADLWANVYDADEYTLCYNMQEIEWITVCDPVHVAGAVWIETTPSPALRGIPFTLNIHGVGLSGTDTFGMVKSNEGCNAIGAGTSASGLITVDDAFWSHVSMGTLSSMPEDYVVCYRLDGRQWLPVDGNFTVNGWNSFITEPEYLAHNVIFDVVVKGHNLSVNDMYDITPIDTVLDGDDAHPDPCMNVTGWDVFPWMLTSTHGEYNDTVTIDNQKFSAGRYAICYNFPGLGWQVIENITIAGPMSFTYWPFPPERRTDFGIQVEGLVMLEGDEVALVNGPYEEEDMLIDICSETRRLSGREISVTNDMLSGDGTILNLNDSVFLDIWKTARTWTLCYNARGLPLYDIGWEAIPGGNNPITFIDLVEAPRIQFKCTPKVLHLDQTSKCVISSYDSGGELYGDSNETALFAVRTEAPDGAPLPDVRPVKFIDTPGKWTFYVTPYALGVYKVYVTHRGTIIGTPLRRIRVFRNQEVCRLASTVEKSDAVHEALRKVQDKLPVTPPRTHETAWAAYPPTSYPGDDVPRTAHGHVDWAPENALRTFTTLNPHDDNTDSYYPTLEHNDGPGSGTAVPRRHVYRRNPDTICEIVKIFEETERPQP